MINLLIGFAALTNIGLAILTLSRNKKSLSTLSYAILAFLTGTWTLFFIPYNLPFIFDSLFWIKAVYFMVILMVGALINFSYAFPYGEKLNSAVMVFYTILNLPIIYMLVFTDKFVRSVTMSSFGPETAVGPYYGYGAMVWGLFGLGTFAYKFFNKYKTATSRAKFQLKYMFLGWMMFGLGAVVLDGIIPVFFHTTAFFSLSAIFSLFFTGLTAYAVVRHRFLDITIALQEILAYGLTTTLTFIFFAAGATSYWILSDIPIKYEVMPVILLISSVLAFMSGKLVIFSHKIVAGLTNQPFYDFEKTILKVSLDLATSLDIQRLLETLSRVFTEVLGVQDMAIILKNQEKYNLVKQMGFAEGLLFLSDANLINYLEKNPKLLVLDELGAAISESTSDTEQFNLRNLATHLELSKVSLIVPLSVQNQLFGLIVLGSKPSGDPYTVQDIHLLNTISFQALNAIENALSYEEIRKFNITLKDEVTKATANLQVANEKLKELDHLKDDFVSVASHELRTPMTAIRSYAWMALHRPDVVLTEKMKRYLSRTLISTERLINLVNDMLNISRIESGKVAISPAIIDLHGISEEVMEDVASRAAEKNIHLTIENVTVPKAFADPDKVHQVLLNLVGNSLKFTPEGGTVSINFFTDGIWLEVSVRDNGTGISHDDIQRLFKKFARLDSSYISSSSSNGTGLGLFICRSLVELMQGKIWATSEGVGRGSTFTFSLPVANAKILAEADKFFVRPKGEVKGLEPSAL